MGAVFRIPGKLEVHCYAEVDEIRTAPGVIETALKEFMRERNALGAGRIILFFPKNQRNATVDSHRQKCKPYL
jgi:hypothetical protein